MFWTVVAVLAGGYLAATLVLTYLVHRLPRRPVVDPPDWGETLDTRVPTRGGGRLELWRIVPDGPVRGTVVMIHGWSRNRDWMNLLYRFRMKAVSPERLAPHLPMPALVIHGAEDRRFPAAFARRLHRAFPEGRARLLVVPGAGHSESSAHPLYPEAVAGFLAAHPEACAATIAPAHRTWR